MKKRHTVVLAVLIGVLVSLSPASLYAAETGGTVENAEEGASSSGASGESTAEEGGTAEETTSQSFDSAASNQKINDANTKKNQAEQSLNSINSQISGIENKQAELQSEMNALDAELSEILVNIAILEEELQNTQQELLQVNQDLAAAEEKEAEEYANMKLRIQYMYENSSNDLMGALLGAGDFSELLNRIEYVESMYSYDRRLLTNYQNTVQEVTDLRESVLDTQDELEEIQTEYEAQQVQLEEAIASKASEQANFSQKLKEAEALAAAYSQTISEQNAIIKEEQQKQEEARKKKEAEEKAKAAAAAANASKTASTGTTGTGGTAGGGTSGGGTTADTGTGTGTGDTGSSSGGTQNPSYTTGVSGADVVNYAMQFIGNPYVLGGTSLTNGCDCSGFTQSVYAHFGISIPRTSGSQALCGSAVSYDAAQPGDLVCYVGHVGIYIGGGQIVNASTARTGIKTQSATYRSILTVRRVL